MAIWLPSSTIKITTKIRRSTTVDVIASDLEIYPDIPHIKISPPAVLYLSTQSEQFPTIELSRFRSIIGRGVISSLLGPNLVFRSVILWLSKDLGLITELRLKPVIALWLHQRQTPQHKTGSIDNLLLTKTLVS